MKGCAIGYVVPMWFFLACASPEAPPAPTTAPSPTQSEPRKAVRVALNWVPEPEFGGFYAAALSGLYTKAGLAVEIIPGGPGAPVLEMLQAGRADVVITGADDLLVKREKGVDAVAVWASFQHSPVGLMAHKEGPSRYADVRGPVAIEAGSPFQQFLWSSLGWEGKVQMVPTSGGIGAFATDKALVQQAYVTSEPCVAEGKGLAVNFLPGSEVGWDPYAGLIVVPSKEKDLPWVKQFVDASRAGWTAYLEQPDAANAELARLNPQIPAPLMGCITEKQRPFVVGDGLGLMTATRWEAAAAALTKIGTPARAEGAWVSL